MTTPANKPAADGRTAVPVRRLGIFPRVCVPVFLTSALLIATFVIGGVLFQEHMERATAAVQTWIAHELGWFHTAAVAIFPLLCLWLAFGRHGDVRLGRPGEQPEYDRRTWFALLFSAGMGIGLLFWGVAEPLSHYVNPPPGLSQSGSPGALAMRLTFFHWGLHAWSIYVLAGLGIALFAFRHGLPLAFRSVLHPLIGERLYGPLGHAVDVIAVVGTLFGVATSLGLGVLQVNAGLDYLLGVGESTPIQLALVALVTGLATTSVWLGMDAGVARLSRITLRIAALLLVTVLLLGPTGFLLDALLQATGDYLGHLVQLSLWTQAAGSGEWQADWTLFYWGWWISWSPFVGSFIARVSRGRTIREFVLGVLLVPMGVVLLWMTVFGAQAIYLEHTGGAALAHLVEGDASRAFFGLLDALPAAPLTATVATLVIVLFFVTSSDSGSLVIDMLTSGGATDAPRSQRVFWAVLQGLVAATLLLAGGLAALQVAAITTGLPVAVVLLILCYAVVRALGREGDAPPGVADPEPRVPARAAGDPAEGP